MGSVVKVLFCRFYVFYVITLKICNKCIVGGCYRTRPTDRTASFYQFPIPRRKSSVVNGCSSFNIISSTSGTDDEDDEEVVSGAGAYRFQPIGTLS